MSRAAPGTRRIVVPAENCWRVERARRFRAIQDGADYFRLVRDALLGARHTVFILGWDITGGIDLVPGAPATDGPTRLDALIAWIARRRPRLRCYILVWDYGLLFTLERDPLSRWRFGWRMPRGVRFGFDDRHPVGACHHQKVVVVDDDLAFCGGLDLTSHRWDTPAHQPDEPSRVTPLGVSYGPYHEVQAMAEGPVAAALGALVRDRWRALGVHGMPRVATGGGGLWPSDVAPDFTDADVAIARTLPRSAGRPPVRECEALFLDAIAQARRTIYIENQYFTNTTLSDALAARLAEPDGPEVVLVLPRDGDGWLERHTIERLRRRACRRLIAADAYQRLRLVYPMASRARDVATFVHSKVMIVDDRFVRIGSANTNHRSMGVDTECDLAVDAASGPGMRTGIRGIRDRLIAEHLGLPAETAARAIARAGSIRSVVDSHQHQDHTLVPFELAADDAAEISDAMRAAVDPDEPMGFGPTLDALVPAVDAPARPAPLRLWIVPAAAAGTAILVVWVASAPLGRTVLGVIQDAIAAARTTALSTPVALAVFVVGSFALIPIELLVIAAGVMLGAVHGGLIAGIGSLAAAVIGYLAGRAMRPAALARWMSPRSYRSSRQLGAQGLAGVAMLRLAAVASAGATHLICGAGRVPFAAYLGGTAIGLGPIVVALSGFGALIGHTLLHPSATHVVLTAGAGLLLAASTLGLRALILIRQFAPSLSRHRERAEFG